ncbi:MAG TPA: ABC transporter permease [Cyclobacteriaceae bacterium]|nr:ABC transporter permease [Cyclobacteriaceae bacterium]HMV08020.1 ABC transporter permease [Cyclobacteriaceae bacterium]HMV91051.1 ABC transporter permease [Cyclobacteriaceae bacterium]HMX00660.1 ABC transporter permease [Cyclobacteriaceae bacterium]HMX49465.1 ABC transporter permease [Cyclobacteriaceae bacterium]
MLRNFFVITIRSFFRQKFYSFINVLGLTSGLACTLFIYLWINDEVSKDKFHNDIDNIYQVVTNIKWDGEMITWESTPGPLADEIKANIPEVAAVARYSNDGDQLFTEGERNFLEHGYFADPEFFKVFSFPVIKGNSANPLSQKGDVVITERLAKKLFGDQDPIGKTVRVQNRYDQKVSAVLADITDQSSIQFDFIMPFDIHKEYRQPNWDNADYNLYVKLNDPAQASLASDNINAMVDKITLQQDPKAKSDEINFYLQPFAEHYLNSTFENGLPAGGRIKYVQIFSVVAIFILVIACINFMNMATAKAVNRAKEVGVRKVIGAQRKSLIFQFIGESISISFISMALAIAMVYLLLPFFNVLVVKHIALNLTDLKLLGMLAVIVLVTGVLAGSYPAFFLSAFQPSQVLKGNTNKSLSGSTLRKALVVFQFSLTVILIACSLVIYNQIEFIRSTNLGYNRESVITFNARGGLSRQFESFKQEALQFPAIKTVSKSNSSLVEIGNQNSSVQWSGKPEDSDIFFRTVVVDYDFVETMGLTLLEGRFFKKEFNDTNNFIVTKHAVEIMGLENPIGQEIVQWGTPGKIVGVVEDFHGRSLHEKLDPIVLMCKPEWTGTVFIRIDGDKAQEAIAHLESLSKKFNPKYDFAYSFVDDDFERLYSNEKVTGSLALSFTIMAIIISGLGLLGLAAYTAERKRKEISIRKTMGASVSGIVTMMSADFVKLSLLAALIGCPTAWYFMSKFLEGYAYHTELGWGLFALTAGCVLLISLVTVMFQVAKAAIANPIDALRNE